MRDRLDNLIRKLEKHLPGTHSQKTHGRRGAGERKKLVRGLARIFSDPGDGATVFPKGNAPPANGFHILAAGNQANAAKVGKVYASHGLWTNDDGKQFVEPSFYVHTDGAPRDVLRRAEQLRRANQQESVGVVYHDTMTPLPGFEPAHSYRVFGPKDMVTLINPSRKKLLETKELLGGKGVQIALQNVQVKWLAGDQVEKAAKHPQKPRYGKQSYGLSDYYMKDLDKMIDDLNGGMATAGIINKLEGEELFTQSTTVTCKGYDRDGEIVVECDGGA